MNSFSSPVEILAQYEGNIKDAIAIVQSSKLGFNSHVFYDLATLSGLNKDRLADDLLGLSLKTIQRYAQEEKPMPPRQAEAALKLMALYKKGIEVFGDKDHFNRWLQKPAFGLGNQIPFELLVISTGIDLVMDELLRIEFGALA